MKISKSEYMMFLKHPAWLWLKKHDKKKLPEPDARMQALFDAGYEFEKYAEKLFPNGKRLGFECYQEYLSLPQRTEDAINNNVKTIFQARLETENITCISDVLDKVGDNLFDLYEIKSTTKIKPEHYLDLAFQVVVIENFGLKIRNISVIYVNNDYVRDGDIDVKKITVIEDITDKVREKIVDTKNNIIKALDVANSSTMPDPSPRFAKLGSLSEWMDIYKALGNKVDKYSIYNLTAPGIKRIGELEDIGIKSISDIPEDFKVTPKQQRQIKATKEGKRIINVDGIREFLKSIKYPIYFLDYETTMGVIPLYNGTRPYQQVPFQYSLHVIETPGDEIKHYEYIHKDENLPVENLLKQLRNDIQKKGSILVWYEGFEKTRNEEMAVMFPEFKDFLKDVNDRVIDLMRPFADGLVVDKDFFGSASIKKVLPVMAPELSYKNLDIQEGSSAQRLWTNNIVKNAGEEDKDKLLKNLLKYCEMDTFAMVRIWQELGKI